MIALRQQTIRAAGYGRVWISIRHHDISDEELVFMLLADRVSEEMEAYLATTYNRRLEWNALHKAWYLSRLLSNRSRIQGA